MNRKFRAYRAVYEQGFLPIFTKDPFDSKMEIEACIKAGCKAIEYTLRREDAHIMIPYIRKTYPDLYLLVGSTVDSDAIVAAMKPRFPQLMTIDALVSAGAVGLVSMLGYSEDTLRKYGEDVVIAPLAETVTEALTMMRAGASFIKMDGQNLAFVRRARAAATFDFCPVFVTGGMTVARIPEAVEAGAVLAGAGFDLLLKDQPADITSNAAAAVLAAHIRAMQQARAAKFPQLAELERLSDAEFIAALPHYHCF